MVRSSKVAWATYFGERSALHPEVGDDASSSSASEGAASVDDEVLAITEEAARSPPAYSFARDVPGSSYEVDLTRCDNPRCDLPRGHFGGHSFELHLSRASRRARPPSASLTAAD